jgi:hypothetical protein
MEWETGKGEVVMIKLSIRIVVVLGLLSMLASCSLDRCQIISHPSAAKPGDTITVLFSDIYIVLSATRTTTVAYARDSLHIGYGLPADWSVLSSAYYIATGIRMSQMASLMNDPTQIMSLIQDSLAVYMSRQSPMTPDAGWRAFFTGKTFKAHNIANNDSIVVTANAVGQWSAYSGRVNISIPAGTRMDTAVALSALPLSTATQSQIKFLYKTDSIYVKAVPVVCFAQVIAGQAEGIDTLLYYTKTDSISTSTSTYNFDKGDMTYVPISIAPQNAVRVPLSNHSARSLLTVSPAILTPGARISLSVGAHAPWRLCVSNAQGETVRSFNGTTDNLIQWDGTSSTGGVLRSGLYYVRLEGAAGEKTAAQALRIIK